MIDKRLPRSLNNSADSRIRGVSEMTDALNILVTGESSNGSADGSESGDSGVIKPINGNQVAAVMDDYFSEGFQKVVIGSVRDQKYGFVYFFVFSEDAEEMGVYRVNANLNVQRIFASRYFNFRSDGFVKGDIAHLNSQNVDETDRTILYFTDNVNEPRRLDVNRALAGNLDAYEQEDILDAICACPRTPVAPPTWFFFTDETRTESLFKDISPFQYAYQNIYVNGEESALSTYSTYAIPPAYIAAGNDLDFNVENACTITIPREGYTQEVESIRILARNSESNDFYIIDEVPPVYDGDTTFTFFNDSVVIGYPEYEISKQFDNLPKRARAQTLSENRLFYGDYVEGFDPIQTNATLTVEYQTRDQDFRSSQASLVPEMFNVGEEDQGEIKNRVAGLKIENLNLPSTINLGDSLNIFLTVYPKQNWIVYDGRTNFHPYSERVDFGGQDILYFGASAADAVIGANEDGVGDVSSLYAPDPENVTGEYVHRYAGMYNGVAERNFSTFAGSVQAKWKVLTGELQGTEFDAAYGTSSENALIVRGQSLSFSVQITATESHVNLDGFMESVVAQALTGGTPSGFDVVDSESTYTYSYNLGLNHGDAIFPSMEEAELVCGVVNHGLSLNQTPQQKSPIGSFIMDEATVTTRLVQIGDDGLGLDLVSITDVLAKTCIPDFIFRLGGAFGIDVQSDIQKYVVLDPNESQIINSVTNPNFGNFLPTGGGVVGSPSINLIDVGTNNTDIYPSYDSLGIEQKTHVGYLILPNNFIFRSYEDRGLTYEIDAVSIMDGVVGPGGKLGPLVEDFPLNPNLYVFGSAAGPGSEARVLPLVRRFLSGNANIPYSTFENSIGYFFSAGEENLELAYSNSDLAQQGGSVPGSYGRSFKTNANHSFGIVYYDQRGRASDVMSLGSVYVQGLGEREGGLYGAAYVNIDLDHSPPPWAWNYQIVYTGNTSVSKFIQYTAAGAFVESGEDENIYVSLNYLQENSKVSYAKTFGARTPAGDNRLYQYQEGDKLRIISYNPSNDESNLRPANYVYDVIDFVTLTRDPESNPLYEEGDDINAGNYPKVGDFVVLKNKPGITEFSSISVQDGTDKWNNRCLVELFSPSKFSDLEDKIYFETSNVYRILFDDINDQLIHEETYISIQNGDVFWRRGAIKMPPFNIGQFDNQFQDMVIANNKQFSNFYIESDTFSDLVRFSDVDDFGKPKAILPNSQEVRRGSTISYGEATSYSSSLVKFTSFNTSLGNFKDIPNSYGSINYIHAFNEFIVCIQEEKISRIPVNRNIISDAGTNQQLVATLQVLGNQSFFSGDYGCDGHPESVVIVDNDVYFADLGGEKVIRFNRLEGGVSVISDNGMKEFFERQFRQLGNNPRIVGGYDPLNDEFLISMYNQNTMTSDNVLFPLQPLIGTEEEDDTESVENRISSPSPRSIDPAQELNNLIPEPQTIPITPRVSASARSRNQDRFNKIKKGASVFSVAPKKRDGHSDEEIIEFFTNIYTAGPGDQIVFEQGTLDNSPIMYIGGFYNYFNTGDETTIEDHTRVFEEIENKCFIDCFGAGPVASNDFYKKGGVFTDRQFRRMASTHRSVSAFAEANPDKVTGFNPNRVFDPVFIPGAFVTERKEVDSQWSSFYNQDNHENVEPYYSDGSGTYFHFGKYGTMNTTDSFNGPIKIYDARIHGGVLAMIDYMPFRDYFRYKLHSVSPKFGVESVPEDPEFLILHGFRDHGAVAGMGYTPYPGWAPCSIRTYAQWTSEIVEPFFSEFGGQEVLPVLEQFLRNPGHDIFDDLTGGVVDENNMSDGHYEFFNNIVNQTSGGAGVGPGAEGIGTQQALPTYGPLVYDFDCDGVWGPNDLAIWQAITQHWSSLGDDSLGPDDIEPLAANYFCPAHNAIKTVSRAFSGTNFNEGAGNPGIGGFDPFGINNPDPQPGGIWNLLQGGNNQFDTFTPSTLPISGDNRACFNWNKCLNQIPFNFVQPPGPPVSPVGAISPYFNLPVDTSTTVMTPGASVNGALYNDDGTWYSNILVYSNPDGNNFTSAFNLEERPTDSFFPITKYWA